MTHTESVAVMAQAIFGRDGAMFESLLGFVAQLSLVLWGLVILTVVIRYVGIWTYRRGAARTALVEAVAPIAGVPAAVVPITMTEIDLVQPAAPVPTTKTQKDAVLVPAELVDILAIDAVTNATFDEALQPAEAPAAVAASVKVPRRAPPNRRAEPRSAAHVPALRRQLHGGVSMDIALVGFWLPSPARPGRPSCSSSTKAASKSGRSRRRSSSCRARDHHSAV